MKANSIIVIGAVNMDLVGFPDKKLIYNDDVAGYLHTSFGGVGRNIAVNLSKLGFEVEFLTVIADDQFGKEITTSCNQLKISIKHSFVKKGANSSTFMAIMNSQKNMELGIAAMHIYNDIPESFILNNIEIIRQNKYCVLETNMPKSILELIVKKAPNTTFFLDTVSGTKALKSKNILPQISVLKCNLIEAELLANIQVNKEEDYTLLIQYFLTIGVKKIFITLGKNGVIYGDKSIIKRLIPKYINPTNTSGGGDAFMAGLLLAEVNNYDIHHMAKIATKCAELTIQHKENVHPNITKQLILQK